MKYWNELKDIVLSISKIKKFDKSMIEKDYYITLFFKELEKIWK